MQNNISALFEIHICITLKPFARKCLNKCDKAVLKKDAMATVFRQILQNLDNFTNFTSFTNR